ncbi:GNAT family N-acetyltransferase [Planosporangium thailandense]|uniref:GNAT family N-acetyltransferase n=1 Tax=Planosporangium thailandense TaxID=765197 RepID=A0ABX0XYF8_9ACTN|nr:GNAT family N-acetyltransferase [Planosporangium thailandense]
MTVVVRVARPDEYDEIGRLTVLAYDKAGQLGGEIGYERTLADVAGRADEGDVLVAVDESTGRLLGSVTFVLPGSRYSELARADEAEFRMLAVDPEEQGRGVGRLLVGECLRRAAGAGCAAVVICYRDFVAAAEGLYSGLGFQRLPERDWSPMPGVNLLALRRTLPAR